MRWFELLPLLLIALLIFGTKRMPEIGASIGKTIREFQKSIREVTGGFDESVMKMNAPEPVKTALPPTAPDLPAATLSSAPPAASATAEAASGESAAAEPVSATTSAMTSATASATTSAQPGAE